MENEQDQNQKLVEFQKSLVDFAITMFASTQRPVNIILNNNTVSFHHTNIIRDLMVNYLNFTKTTSGDDYIIDDVWNDPLERRGILFDAINELKNHSSDTIFRSSIDDSINELGLKINADRYLQIVCDKAVAIINIIDFDESTRRHYY